MDSQRDLEEIAYCLSAHFRQTGDIALSGEITGGNIAGTVIGQEQTGGIAGWLNQGSIGNSTSAANVTGDYLMRIRGKGTGTRYVLVTVT